MARSKYLWPTCLTVLALSACSGSESGFFSPVVTPGAGNSSQGGAGSSAGSIADSSNPGIAGSALSPGSAGRDEAGGGRDGAQTGGASAGGAGPGGATSGGSAGSSAGAGPHAGAGGSGASAGHAGAHGGSAGAGGANQDLSCADLVKLANQQLEAARVCNEAADAIQCTGKVKTPCNCEVPVQRNASSETKAYLNTLKQIEDKDCVQVCTAIACPSLSNAQCRTSGNSNMGTCVASYDPD